MWPLQPHSYGFVIKFLIKEFFLCLFFLKYLLPHAIAVPVCGPGWMVGSEWTCIIVDVFLINGMGWGNMLFISTMFG